MTDLEFVQKCASGDKRSWDEFVDRYSRLIYAYIHKTLASAGHQTSGDDAVGDLFQDIFLSLAKDNYSKLRTFRGLNGCSLASWLRQVVVHAVIDYLRSRKNTLSLDEGRGDDGTLADVLADESPSVREALMRQDHLASLAECVGALTGSERFFLELYLNRSLGIGGLTRVLRISRSAADMRKSRIVVKLKDCFKRKGFLLDF